MRTIPYAVITVDNIDKREAGYVHFKCKAQKAWNCNVAEIIADLTEGERYKIDYNETAPSGGRKYGSKYINRARLWQEDDGPNTWPDKEPYTGGNSGSNSGGGSMNKKSDYDPAVGMRQTGANCAMAFCANAGMTLEDLKVNFPIVADMVVDYVKGPAKGDDSGSSSGTGDADIPF